MLTNIRVKLGLLFAVVTGALLSATAMAGAAIGDGTVDDVTGDDFVTDGKNVFTDLVGEFAPNIISVLAAVISICLVFLFVRYGYRKVRGAAMSV